MKSYRSRLIVHLCRWGLPLFCSVVLAAEHGGETKGEPGGEVKAEAKTEVKPGHANEPLAAHLPPFELSIRPDTQSLEGGISLLKLKKMDPTIPAKSIGEVVVRWTSPTGHRTSFPMKAVSEDVWANRMTLDSPAGRGSMNVVILGRTENGYLGRTTELIYDFDMPGLILSYRERKDLGESSGAAKVVEHGARDPEDKKKFAWSVPVIAILVMVANVVLLIPILIVINVIRRMAKGKDRHGAVLPHGAPALHPVYGQVLAGAGLIDHQGEPVAWEEAKPEKSVTEKKPVRQESVRTRAKTFVAKEKGPFRAYTADEVQHMTTEDIFELVDDTLERMEFGGSSDELKEMIRIAEKELAQRDQEREAREGHTATDKLIAAGATINDGEKFDLKNLSF